MVVTRSKMVSLCLVGSETQNTHTIALLLAGVQVGVAILLPGCESPNGLSVFEPGPGMVPGSPLLPLSCCSHIQAESGGWDIWKPGFILILAVPPTHWATLEKLSPICNMKRLDQTSDPNPS